MGQTSNLKLSTISASDDMTVKEFFQRLAGSDYSNMTILDTKIGELTSVLTALNESFVGENGYAARIAANEAAIKAIQEQLNGTIA